MASLYEAEDSILESNYIQHIGEFLSLPQLDKNEILKSILIGWDLECLFQHFSDEEIYEYELKVLSPDTCLEFVKGFKMGTQIKFKHELTKWQKEQQICWESPSVVAPNYMENGSGSGSFFAAVCRTETSCQSFPSVAAPSAHSSSSQLTDLSDNSNSIVPSCSFTLTSSSSSSSPEINLPDILCQSNNIEGKLIDSSYQKDGHLNKKTQIILADLIVDYFISNGLQMTTYYCEKLANQICLRYKGEVPEFYYARRKGATPQGRFYFRFHNIRQAHKRAGLFSSTSDKLKHAKLEKIRKPLEDSDNADEHIRAIKHDNLKPAEFAIHWNGCAKRRMDFIKSSQSLAAITSSWPEYKSVNGYRLICSDFGLIYTDTKSLLDDFAQFAISMRCIFEKQIKDITNRQIFSELSKEWDNISDDGKFAAVLFLLHAVLKSNARSMNKAPNGAKVVSKYSIRECQQSFIYISKTLIDVEEHIQNLLQKGEPIQPFIILIGESIFRPISILIYVDGVKFQFKSILKAVDICFKTFYLFNLNYPIAGFAVWQFLQLYFYKLKSDGEQFLPCVKILMNDLKQTENN